MQTSSRFTQISRVLRFGSGLILISAAFAALAFVATTNNMLTTGNGSPGTTTHRLMKQQAQYGLASRNEASDKERAEDPTAGAVQDYCESRIPCNRCPIPVDSECKKCVGEDKITGEQERRGGLDACRSEHGEFPGNINF